jgi:co-chaperonin GroES (HSP10)
MNSRMKVDTRGLAERDPKISFKDAVLPIIGEEVEKNWDVLGNRVLVATYIKASRTPGGIILTDKAIDEDRWQGKVGLVMKMGANAFKYIDGSFHWEGPKAKPGDYVVYTTSDTREIGILGVSCRFIDYSMIQSVIRNPDAAY